MGKQSKSQPKGTETTCRRRIFRDSLFVGLGSGWPRFEVHQPRIHPKEGSRRFGALEEDRKRGGGEKIRSSPGTTWRRAVLTPRVSMSSSPRGLAPFLNCEKSLGKKSESRSKGNERTRRQCLCWELTPRRIGFAPFLSPSTSDSSERGLAPFRSCRP